MFLDWGQEGKTFWTDGGKHNPTSAYSFLHECNYDFLVMSPDVWNLSHSAFTYRQISSLVTNKALICVCACVSVWFPPVVWFVF
jgi:hypothetical protein